MRSAKEVAQVFAFEGQITEVIPYGNGHINDTHRVTTTEGDKTHVYILQRVNRNVFKRPDQLMDNFGAVTAYLSKIIRERGGDETRECLSLIPTKDGKPYQTEEDGEVWRALLFIRDSASFDKVETPEQFYLSAVAFGGFQYLLRDFPAETLYETIPNFHNTPDRYRQLDEAIAADKCGRAKDIGADIAFALARRDFAGTLERAHAEGKLPLRVTHNDTKLNNILFDRESGKPVCIIDLDTIMPGYAINDFGDSIRFGATTALEDEADLSKVNFDISLFEMYVKGFIEGAAGGLTEGELALMPEGAIMMTLECGTRFLADYLNGDTYFRTSRPGQNLDRARNQFKLVADMEKVLPAMHAIVDKYAKR